MREFLFNVSSLRKYPALTAMVILVGYGMMGCAGIGLFMSLAVHQPHAARFVTAGGITLVLVLCVLAVKMVRLVLPLVAVPFYLVLSGFGLGSVGSRLALTAGVLILLAIPLTLWVRRVGVAGVNSALREAIVREQ